MTAAEGVGFEQRRVIQKLFAVFGAAHRLHRKGYRRVGGIADLIILIRNAHPHGGHLKQRVIAGVGGDQARLQAAFHQPRKEQAVGHGHVTGEIVQKRGVILDIDSIEDAVGQRRGDKEQRQPDGLSSTGAPAFIEHDGEGADAAQRHKAHDGEIARTVGVAGVPPLGQRRVKGEDHLVQVVGQHQQEQAAGQKIQQPCPAGQPVILRLVQRRRHKHREQRDKQHGEIEAVPQIADGSRRGDEEVFDRSIQQPEDDQSRDRGEEVPCLRLHHPAAQGDSPRSKEPQIEEAAHNTQRTPGDFPPDVPAEHGGKDHQ